MLSFGASQYVVRAELVSLIPRHWGTCYGLKIRCDGSRVDVARESPNQSRGSRGGPCSWLRQRMNVRTIAEDCHSLTCVTPAGYGVAAVADGFECSECDIILGVQPPEIVDREELYLQLFRAGTRDLPITGRSAVIISRRQASC